MSTPTAPKHADSPVDAGLGIVVEERRNIGGHLQFKIRWHFNIYDGTDGHWYAYPNDFDDIVTVA